MSTKRRIDRIINREVNRKRAKDYGTLIRILKLYWGWRFESMSMEIYFYGDKEFTIDLWGVLNDEFSNENVKSFYFQDIMGEYQARLEWVWETAKMKKERRKYLLY